MTIDSLFAVTGLVIAVYALMPKYRRLELFLRMRLPDWCVLVGCIALVLYLQYYEFFSSLGWAPSLGFHRIGITPQNASFLVVASSASFILLRLYFAPIMPSKLSALINLCDELLWAHRFLDIAQLMERNMAMVISASLPNNNSRARSANDLFRRLFASHDFTSFLATHRPSFAIAYISSDAHRRCDFIDVYFRALMADHNSPLYSELRNSQNFSIDHIGYQIQRENSLLYSLFHDADVAELCEPYRPVGEYLLEYLNKLYRSPDTDSNNDSVDRGFYDHGKWKCPLYAGIHFFDVMVSRAIAQGVTWHMWLYYFPHIARRICRNYKDPVDNICDYSEWHNRYCYLLYSMFSAMHGWIVSVTHAAFVTTQFELESVDSSHQNDNIPKSAIIALGQCMDTVMAASQLPDDFKEYLIDMTLSTFLVIRPHELGADYAKVLLVVLSESKYRRDYKAGATRIDRINHDESHVNELLKGLGISEQGG